MPITKQTIAAATRHLRRADRVMRACIDRVGPFTLRPQRDRFGMLVRSIISQQISTAAARSIRRKLEETLAPEKVTPESLARLQPRQLKAAGISPQKAGYLADLTERALAGQLQLSRIGRLDDEAIIGRLTQVKGIGRWTAQMFLIFALGRLDVLPHDDLGIKTALRDLYKLDDLPDKAQCWEIAAPWRPYATVASWYCWRQLDQGKKTA